MRRRWWWLGSVVVVGTVVGGLFAWKQWPIWQAQKTVADTLIDPTSALFRGMVASDGVICGQVNSKNRMGAYVGFTDFAIDASGSLLIAPTDSFNESTVGKSASELKAMLNEAEGRLALLTRIQALCGTVAGQGLAAGPKRTDFEVRNFEEPEPDLLSALERSAARCVKHYTFRHKTERQKILVQCEDPSGKESHWIWSRGDKTASGPIFNLPT